MKFQGKFASFWQLNSPNSRDKFQICCTDMYLIRFLANFGVFCTFLWISRDLAGLPEFRGSTTVPNIRSPDILWADSFTLYKLVTKTLYLGTIFPQLVAKRRPEDFLISSPVTMSFLWLSSDVSFTSSRWEISTGQTISLVFRSLLGKMAWILLDPYMCLSSKWALHTMDRLPLVTNVVPETYGRYPLIFCLIYLSFGKLWHFNILWTQLLWSQPPIMYLNIRHCFCAKIILCLLQNGV